MTSSTTSAFVKARSLTALLLLRRSSSPSSTASSTNHRSQTLFGLYRQERLCSCAHTKALQSLNPSYRFLSPLAARVPFHSSSSCLSLCSSSFFLPIFPFFYSFILLCSPKQHSIEYSRRQPPPARRISSPHLSLSLYPCSFSATETGHRLVYPSYERGASLRSLHRSTPKAATRQLFPKKPCLYIKARASYASDTTTDERRLRLSIVLSLRSYPGTISQLDFGQQTTDSNTLFLHISHTKNRPHESLVLSTAAYSLPDSTNVSL